MSEEARQARLQEMPSPAPAPASAVVHAEPIDDWTHKPFFTTTVHAGEHEFSLSHNEDADLVVRVFNTNSGDRFERIVGGDEGIAQLVPSDMPAGAKSSEGFAQFLQLAQAQEKMLTAGVGSVASSRWSADRAAPAGASSNLIQNQNLKKGEGVMYRPSRL